MPLSGKDKLQEPMQLGIGRVAIGVAVPYGRYHPGQPLLQPQPGHSLPCVGTHGPCFLRAAGRNFDRVRGRVRHRRKTHDERAVTSSLVNLRRTA